MNKNLVTALDIIRLLAALLLMVLFFTGGPTWLVATLITIVIVGLIWSALRWRGGIY